MARKLIDIMPVVTVCPRSGITTEWPAAEAEAAEIAALVATAAGADKFDTTVSFEADYRCEHCNGTWTEDDPAYNGGCCDKDQANDPVRLASLRKLADEVSGADLYRIDSDGRRDRVAIDWPWALAAAVQGWLDTGRPVAQVPALIEFAERVDATEWCTVWSDPGVYPSNAGGSPLPDQVSTATEPNELASDLRGLLDDMGVLTADAVAA